MESENPSYRRRRYRRWNNARMRSDPVELEDDDQYQCDIGWVCYNGTVVPYRIIGRDIMRYINAMKHKFILMLQPVVHSPGGSFYSFYYYLLHDYFAQVLIQEHMQLFTGRPTDLISGDIGDIHSFLASCYDGIFNQVVSRLPAPPGTKFYLKAPLTVPVASTFCTWCAAFKGQGYPCQCGRLTVSERPPSPESLIPENGIYYGNLAAYYTQPPPAPNMPQMPAMPPMPSVYNYAANPYYQNFPLNYFQSPPALCTPHTPAGHTY